MLCYLNNLLGSNLWTSTFGNSTLKGARPWNFSFGSRWDGCLGLRPGIGACQGGQPPRFGGCCQGALNPGHRRHEVQEVDLDHIVVPGNPEQLKLAAFRYVGLPASTWICSHCNDVGKAHGLPVPGNNWVRLPVAFCCSFPCCLNGTARTLCPMLLALFPCKKLQGAEKETALQLFRNPGLDKSIENGAFWKDA